MDEKIADLRKIVQNGKLVVFVGSGVSKNSGVPTWGNLVRCFAKKLGYASCIKCLNKSEECHFQCQETVHFGTDDYIRIPQYYFSTYHQKAYEEVIQEVFSGLYTPNILDDLIVNLHPIHIVTTNYDHLLDHYGYEVISQDEELLQAESRHYLIKMHGDLAHLDSLVLKEDDFLQYAEKHPLLELFIKSLLIDHTFLFIGYSLNDYNLKTFLSWIDLFGKEKNVRQRMHRNYWLSTDIAPHEHYLFDYYAHKNIEVIDLNPWLEHPSEQSMVLKDPIGQAVYTVLEMISK